MGLDQAPDATAAIVAGLMAMGLAIKMMATVILKLMNSKYPNREADNQASGADPSSKACQGRGTDTDPGLGTCQAHRELASEVQGLKLTMGSSLAELKAGMEAQGEQIRDVDGKIERILWHMVNGKGGNK